MRRRFAWILVAEVALVGLAVGAAYLQAGTPLVTWRQAVAPAGPTTHATLPVVTTAPETAAEFASPADSGSPESVPECSTLAIPSLIHPIDPQVVAVAATEPVIVAAQPPQPRLAPPPAAPVPIPAPAPDLVPNPGPAPAASPESPQIEPLPAEVAGTGVATSEDPTVRKPLSAIGVNVAPTAGLLPADTAAGLYGAPEVVPRAEQESLFFWQATNLCHRPLYFEQNYLERDGRSFGPIQPIVSGVQFFGTVPLLPLKMIRQPPCRCIYTLGQSRPDGYGRKH